MSLKQKRLFWIAAIVVTVTFTGLLWATVWTKADTPESSPAVIPALVSPTSQRSAVAQTDIQSKLARRPEVFKLNRLLGQRLKGKKAVESVMIGTLTRGSDEQRVRILRRQEESGESVEVFINGTGAPLTWSAANGPKSPGNSLTDNERLLLERLTLDSPDQFVLAQLRGASYYTVGHNVRPAEAGGSDDYAGPLWDILRITEPEGDASSKPQSAWRLFYINTRTGLIDKIMSEEQGRTITAELSAWIEVDGEKVPSRITWSREERVVMQFSLTNFSHN